MLVKVKKCPRCKTTYPVLVAYRLAYCQQCAREIAFEKKIKKYSVEKLLDESKRYYRIYKQLLAALEAAERSGK